MTVVVQATEELQPGMLVGDYRIERVLGVGGMGVVYGARHPVIGKRAAIKVLNARFCADQEGVARFLQEAQAVNQVGHANIVDIFAFGTLDDGRSYLIMEWLQGETLFERLDHSKLSAVEAISILIPLTRALDAAHAAGVIHRDLKPENVILVPEDDTFRVKLLDFGIAKLSTPTMAASKTATGTAMGTPLFMSPEQAKGMSVDARTDTYSLGVLAYLLVCGKTPFEDEETSIEILHAHICKPPPPPRDLTPDLPEDLERLILELLAKKPDGRPALSDVRRRLAAMAGSPFAVDTGVNLRVPAAELESDAVEVPARRSRRWLAVAGLGAIALAATIFVAMRSGSSAETARATPAPTQPAESPAAAQAPATVPAPAPAAPPPDPAPAVTDPAPTAAPRPADPTATAKPTAKPTKPRPRAKSTARPAAPKHAKDADAVVNPFAKKKPK